MIFTPDAIFEARRKLLSKLKDNEAPTPEMCQALLDLDPHDHIAILWQGRLHREAGDRAAAEELYWRSIETQPCAATPYMELSQLLSERPETEALGDALAELGLAKVQPHDDESEDAEDDGAPELTSTDSPEDLASKLRSLPQEEQRWALVMAARARRATEPLEVTERLRHLRMLQDILEEDQPPTEAIDAILNEGHTIVPYLVSILRAWANELLGEEYDSVLKNALALVGELGTAEEIPHLLEFVDLEHEAASGASLWALGRIVQRQTPQARQLFRTLIPELDITGRLTIAEQIFQHRALDPDGKLLESLAENVQAMKGPERDKFFTLFLGGMVAALGARGAQLGRGILLRNRSRLTPRAQRECDDVFRHFSRGSVVPVQFEASKWTVYDICQGRATWNDEDEVREDDAEEDHPPAHEIRRAPAPGRNDPCWCNSGKKYKKCHMESDARGGTTSAAAPDKTQVDEFSALRGRLGEFLSESLNDREKRRAVEEFIGEIGPDGEFDEIALVDWILHDWLCPRFGRTVMQEFLRRHEARLTARERETVSAWAQSFVGLYEVEEIDPGVGVRLRNLVLGGTEFAHDKSMSTAVVKWDAVFARVVPGERGMELAGSGLRVHRHNIASLLEWMEEDRSARSLDWRPYMKSNWSRVRRQAITAATTRSESLRLANSDGYDLVFSVAIYQVGNAASVMEALKKSPKLEAENEDTESHTFVWLNKERTVLGRISLGNGELRLETNSRERLALGKKFLTGLKLQAIQHVRDEFETAEDLKKAAAALPPSEPKTVDPAHEEIPEELQRELLTRLLEDHYGKWPDTKLPGLEGKTPRQAIRSAAGRQAVVEILHTLENGEERKRLDGEVFYDVSKIYAALANWVT